VALETGIKGDWKGICL